MAEFGNFGNVGPEGMAAIKNSLARRQQGGQAPALDQQSGASPTAAPLPPEATGGVGVPQMADTEVPLSAGGNPEAMLLIKAITDGNKLNMGALKDRLKAISTVETGGQ